MKYFTLIIGLLISTSMYAQIKGNAYDYVQQYKDLATSEMARSGIPASIILAQGILESSFGNNSLAKYANNHFALRCNENWDGETFYKWATQNSPTCYKSYLSATESYLEHTDNMSENSKLAELFNLSNTAYKKWAKGLERLGYSGIENYGKQLITIIELYDLNQYDELLVVEEEPIGYAANLEEGELEDEIYYNNGIKAILANGESPLNTASRLDLPLRKLLKYNDLTSNGRFYPGQFVYLQNKKNTFNGEKEIHVVQSNENVYKIAQLYGIKLKSLYKLNLMDKGQEAATGQRIYLKSKAPRRPTLRPKDEQLTDELNEEEETSMPQPPLIVTTKPTTVPEENLEVPPIPEPKFNLGEYSIHPDKLPKQKVYVYSDEPGYLHQETKNEYYNQIMGDTETGVPTDVDWEKEEQPTTTETSEPGSRRLQPPPIKITPPTESTTVTEMPEPGGISRVENRLNNPPKKEISETPTMEKPEGVYHKVIKGDTLYNISKRYETTVDNIKKFNGLEDNTIGLNQMLRVK